MHTYTAALAGTEAPPSAELQWGSWAMGRGVREAGQGH